jgi:hypothetical protein
LPKLPDTELGLFAVALDAGQTDPCKVMTNVCLSWSERKGELWIVPDSKTEVNGDSWKTFDRETHSKRWATRHDFLPSLLGDGDK